jgi:hypothetical protein
MRRRSSLRRPTLGSEVGPLRSETGEYWGRSSRDSRLGTYLRDAILATRVATLLWCFFVQDLPYGNTEEMGDMVGVMDNEQNYRSIIAAQGAEFRGVQPGPPETLILFADPRLGRTLAVAESEFSSEVVSNRLEESRRAFDLELRVQRSLC